MISLNITLLGAHGMTMKKVFRSVGSAVRFAFMGFGGEGEEEDVWATAPPSTPPADRNSYSSDSSGGSRDSNNVSGSSGGSGSGSGNSEKEREREGRETREAREGREGKEKSSTVRASKSPGSLKLVGRMALVSAYLVPTSSLTHPQPPYTPLL